MLDSESEIRYFTAGEDDDFVSGWYRVEDGKRPGSPIDLSDDQLLVGLNFNFKSLGSVELTGISFHFHDSVSFGGGRVAIPIVTVHFSETLDQQAIINALGGDLSTALSSFNSDGILTNIDFLDDLMGGVGSIGYQIDTL